MPPGGLNIRWPQSSFASAQALEQEMRLHKYKLYAALAFARANKLNRIVMDSPRRRFGIVTCGKSYLDVRQALDDLGIDDAHAAEIGLTVFKVGMTWPLERDGIRHFAEGLEEILVVEEKRALVENQLKEQLYNWNEKVRPRVIGKFDESGEWILPSADELTPARIARVIAKRIARFYTSPRIEQRLAFLEAKERSLANFKAPIRRIAYFCSGCPHNTSTKVPEGSRALAGIGCHFMAQWMDRDTQSFTQMGGEGRDLAGPGALQQDAPCLPESGRRHLLPFRQPGDPRRRRRQCEHHLQAALQRCRGHDRRPAGGWAAGRAHRRQSAPRRGRGQDRHRHRRTGEIPDIGRLPGGGRGLPPRPAGPCPARDARDAGRHGHRLRPDLRGGEAPAAQARADGGSGEAGLHQRAGLRGLRRLRHRLQLPLGHSPGDRVRAQAGDRPIDLQQGFLLRQRLLPQLRHRAWRRLAPA